MGEEGEIKIIPTPNLARKPDSPKDQENRQKIIEIMKLLGKRRRRNLVIISKNMLRIRMKSLIHQLQEQGEGEDNNGLNINS